MEVVPTAEAVAHGPSGGKIVMTRPVRWRWLLVIWLLLAGRVWAHVDFSTDVLPIFAEHCLKCHGPDAAARQAEMRLDRGQTDHPLLPDPEELLRRINSTENDVRMPPPGAGARLSADDIATLGSWVADGANWNEHWSRRPIRRPSLPNHPSLRHPVDRFIFEASNKHNLTMSGEASRGDLVRRVSYSLTGLPPTKIEIDRFLEDQRSDAYSRMVQRYLSSSRYGEHMATFWLDLARYADTNGYHVDNHRVMWRWRDWVVESWNCNQPFDEFTVHQLAGDLLPNADDDTRLATGFHRNTMTMFENGALAEEFLPEYVADRVNTTSAVWLGQTFKCARCHDHKFDPISQRDYYRLFAYFNNIDELGLSGQYEPPKPIMDAPTRLQRATLVELDSAIALQRNRQDERRQWAANSVEEWEADIADLACPAPPKDSAIYVAFDETHGADLGFPPNKIGSILGDVLRLPQGRSGGALLLTDSSRVELNATPLVPTDKSWTLAVWLYITTNDTMVLFRHRATDESKEDGLGAGLEIQLVERKPLLQFTSKGRTPWIAKSVSALSGNAWHHLALSYDAKVTRVSMRIDHDPVVVNQPEKPPANYQSVDAIVALSDKEKPLRGMLDELRFFHRVLTVEEINLLMGADLLAEVLAIDRDERNDRQRALLVDHYLRRIDRPYRAASKTVAVLDERRSELVRRIPTSLIMRERAQRRPTFILHRGDYRQPGEEVLPGTPEYLPSNGNFQQSRLGLARWIVSPENPLTARVFVNYIWRLHFGRGLVATPEDFGVRGEPPTHRLLLDWLASEFIESGWNVKRLHLLILTSSTFRQTSRVALEHRSLDPENLWYCRGPRYRLSAEQIRDTALAVSGLLDHRILGPSVYPYQPPGLWIELSYNPNSFTAQVFRQSHGADLYRRSLYTFWKRSSPPPNMAVFGAPTRETCLLQRARTNTPLQALVLMNDPTFVEAARLLATGLLARQTTDAERLKILWMKTMSRQPTREEIAVTLRSLQKLKTHYEDHADRADQLLTVGEYRSVSAQSVAEVAAWTCLCSVVLQQDEVLTQH